MKKYIYILVFLVLVFGCTKTEQIIAPSMEPQEFYFNPQPNDFVHDQDNEVSVRLEVAGLKETSLINVYFMNGDRWTSMPYYSANVVHEYTPMQDTLIFIMRETTGREIVNIPSWLQIRVVLH